MSRGQKISAQQAAYLGAKLKEMCVSAGLDQKELARDAKIDQGSASKFFNGKFRYRTQRFEKLLEYASSLAPDVKIQIDQIDPQMELDLSYESVKIRHINIADHLNKLAGEIRSLQFEMDKILSKHDN